MVLISSTFRVLLTTSLIVLTINFTNATSFKLLSLKNKDGVKYPDTIITDEVEEVKNKQLDLTDKDGNKLYTTEEGGTADKVQLLDKDRNIAVVIVKADKENADQPKDELLPAEDEDKMINNEDFNKIREELESDNTNSINVQVFKLLPNVDETKSTYWERIKYIIYNNIVSQFEVFINLKGQEFSSGDKNDKINSQRVLLLFIQRVVGTIEKQIYNSQPQNEPFRTYVKERVKVNSESEKEKDYVEKAVNKIFDEENDLQLLMFIQKSKMEIKDKIKGLQSDDRALYLKRSDASAWLQTLRDYNPIDNEPYNVYAMKCYKRNKYPMTKDQIEKHFNQTIKNPDEFPDIPYIFSTLLLKLMYLDPSLTTETTVKTENV